EPEANIEELAQPAVDTGQLVGRRAVTVHGRDAFDDLTNLSGESAGCDLPLLAQAQLLAPEPRDQHGLRHNDETRDSAQRKALRYDERECSQGLAAQEHRGDESIPHEAAHGL